MIKILALLLIGTAATANSQLMCEPRLSSNEICSEQCKNNELHESDHNNMPTYVWLRDECIRDCMLGCPKHFATDYYG